MSGASAQPPVAGSAPPAVRGPALRDMGISRRESVRAESWSLRGASTVTGDVDAPTIELLGDVTVGGRLASRQLSVHGALTVGGSAEVDGPLQLAGTLEVGADARVGDLACRGELRVGGPFTVQGTLRGHGQLVLGGGLSARTVHWDGDAAIAGPLTAEDVQLRLRGSSRVGSVHARRVSVRRSGPPLVAHGQVGIEAIEADDVELAGVRVEFVRSAKVTLGADATVVRLEGSVVAAHPSARVGPEVRSPRFHGIRR